MSWFDTSFSFAKQAMNTAQRSIDRVLDIQEEGGGNGDFATPSASTLPSSSSAPSTINVTQQVSQTASPPAAPNPAPNSSSSSSSSLWLQSKSPSATKPPASTANTASGKNKPSNESTGSFMSTWGGGDFSWGSPSSRTAGEKKQGAEVTGRERGGAAGGKAVRKSKASSSASSSLSSRSSSETNPQSRSVSTPDATRPSSSSSPDSLSTDAPPKTTPSLKAKRVKGSSSSRAGHHGRSPPPLLMHSPPLSSTPVSESRVAAVGDEVKPAFTSVATASSRIQDDGSPFRSTSETRGHSGDNFDIGLDPSSSALSPIAVPGRDFGDASELPDGGRPKSVTESCDSPGFSGEGSSTLYISPPSDSPTTESADVLQGHQALPTQDAPPISPTLRCTSTSPSGVDELDRPAGSLSIAGDSDHSSVVLEYTTHVSRSAVTPSLKHKLDTKTVSEATPTSTTTSPSSVETPISKEFVDSAVPTLSKAEHWSSLHAMEMETVQTQEHASGMSRLTDGRLESVTAQTSVYSPRSKDADKDQSQCLASFDSRTPSPGMETDSVLLSNGVSSEAGRESLAQVSCHGNASQGTSLSPTCDRGELQSLSTKDGLYEAVSDGGGEAVSGGGGEAVSGGGGEAVGGGGVESVSGGGGEAVSGGGGEAVGGGGGESVSGGGGEAVSGGGGEAVGGGRVESVSGGGGEAVSGGGGEAVGGGGGETVGGEGGRGEDVIGEGGGGVVEGGGEAVSGGRDDTLSQRSGAAVTGQGINDNERELHRVTSLLEAREAKMMEMSTETVLLMEANQTLTTELSELRDSLSLGQSETEQLKAEFTRRIASTEKKLQTVIKERDSLRKQLQAFQSEQSQQKHSAMAELSAQLREKDEQIAGLMEEGEKLSKQQFQSSNTVKKLRTKERQNEQLLAAQRQQIEDLESSVKRMKEMLKKKEETERKYQDSLAQLNAIAEQQVKELTALKSEKDDFMERIRGLESNLDTSYKDLSELRKANAVNRSAAHEALIGAEQSAREEALKALEEQQTMALREKESLVAQLDGLRLSVSRTEQQSSWREERMRQEVADLQQRLQESEVRNQELTGSISQATKPLLRQIENLQVAHATQAANWDRVEANLTQRLGESQTLLNHATERERSAVDKEMMVQSRLSALEKQVTSLRQERSQLLASVELERAKTEALEEGQQRETAKMEALRSSFQQTVEELKKEKGLLERQLEYERVRLEAESRKACLESQEKERLRAQLTSSLSSIPHSVSRQSSVSSVQSQSEILEKSLIHDYGGRGGMGGGASVSDGGHFSSSPYTSASAMENLQSLLKQKEGELSSAQNLVSSLERSRAAMAADLADVSAQKDTLQDEVAAIPQLTQQHQELQRKYEALLQMYGEKAELAEELRLDIEDVKAMYKQQIEDLLGVKSLR